MEIIIDDILVHGKDQAEHGKILARVLQIVDCIGLQLNKEKYKMRQSDVSYFGHLVGRDGKKEEERKKPHPERIKAISYLQPPCNVSELRAVLGVFNYLGKFLPNLLTVFETSHQPVEGQHSLAVEARAASSI